MSTVTKALANLNRRLTDRSRRPPIPFEAFLGEIATHPTIVLRNVFQVVHDMVSWYLGTGIDEYPDDPESIHYVDYDTSRLFEEETDRPFFADRLFSNRLVNLFGSMHRGDQQNKIYIFNGPPGCGKSTFLNSLLKKAEAYANSEEGMRYELVWRIEPSLFNKVVEGGPLPLLEQLVALLSPVDARLTDETLRQRLLSSSGEGTIEIPCPSHDHPILIIPKQYRHALFEDLLGTSNFKKTLFNQPEYHWVFSDKPCTFCSSLYRALHNQLKNATEVHKTIYARQYRFNRRIGEGITVFNPGDAPPAQQVVTNPTIQRRLDALLDHPGEVKYLYSRYAKTNNGIYALMDVKSHNTTRLIELHNIISEGVHKVEDVEENVNSLLLAVMNPEDQDNVREFKSFSDRIEYIKVPYVMDLNTEVKIYTHTFGQQIEELFLPRVLPNFARAIIATRMNTRSEALQEWIGESGKYSLYCDKNLQLLKMDIYGGVIPNWLSEEDRKNLTARRRRRIISESEHEGAKGISGRDSIKIFNEFISLHGKQDKLITMSMLYDFFTRTKRELMRAVPEGLLDSLVDMYDYTVLQEVKESLYYYNERQIQRDVLNYLFAVNFEVGTTEVCTFTNDKLEITDAYFENIETRLLGTGTTVERRRKFRTYTQHEYTSKTLTQEIMVGEKSISQTELYKSLRERYVQNIKQKALDPFLDNANFRRAIKDYTNKDFKAYDKRIRDDVRYLIRNLRRKFGYTEKGAQEMCMYVIDNDLARRFTLSA